MSGIADNYKEATEALKTLNIGLLDDTSEAGIRRHFAQQVQNNIDLLAKWLCGQNRNIIIFCSGWKKKFNLEVEQ